MKRWVAWINAWLEHNKVGESTARALRKRADARKFAEDVRTGRLVVDPVSGVVTRTNMGEVVAKHLKRTGKSGGTF